MSDFKTTEKDGVILEEYKGVYSLISTRAGTDGKFYRQFATYQMGRDKHADKDWPVKVTLGTREQATEALRAMLAELSGAPVDDEDVPF